MDGLTLNPAETFQALVAKGRYPEAFALGERLLSKGPTLLDIRTFGLPWPPGFGESFRARHLKLLDRLVSRKPSAWAFFYRGTLRGGPEGLEDIRRLERWSVKRYGWMRYWTCRLFYPDRDFQAAARQLKIALRCRPVNWWAHGTLAELYVCLKKPAAAVRELERARRRAPENEAGDVLAWRGCIDLWLGRYRQALKELEEACALNAQHAYCWRGAATLLLGKPREALELLDRTVAMLPSDEEAYVWRGEARRLLGRHREALEDLSRRPVSLWALVNGALARGALKDEAGMRRDYRRIPESVRDYLRERAGLDSRPVESPRDMKAVLETGLKLARGCRRDAYGQAVWMD